jgi:hypothetical protein
MPARTAAPFEHVHVVRLREQVGRTQTGDTAADDRDPHRLIFAPLR